MRDRFNSTLIAKVVSYDATKQTVNVIPLHKERYDGTNAGMELPQLDEVPVIFPSGGGALMSFPVKPNDIVTIMFHQRSLDEFVTAEVGQQTLEVTPHSRRKFSMSDGIAFPCMYSWASHLNPDPDSPEWKYKGTSIKLEDDGEKSNLVISTTGDVGITINVTGGGDINMNTAGDINMEAEGNVNIKGSIINLNS